MVDRKKPAHGFSDWAWQRATAYCLRFALWWMHLTLVLMDGMLGLRHFHLGASRYCFYGL